MSIRSRTSVRARRLVPALLTALAVVLGAAACGGPAAARTSAPWGSSVTPTPSGPPSTGSPSGTPTSQTYADIPSRDSLIHPTGIYFGASTLKAPDAGESADIATRTGRHPTMLEYYVNWTMEFDAAAVLRSYQLGAVPLMTWEPQDSSHRKDQPALSLRRISQGAFDPYIIRYAEGVRAQKWPVVIRLGHEMNGNWYPWSTGNSGNQVGDYVQAWRHVHDLFANLGVRNVIWLWSPNVIRSGAGTDFTSYYPGDAYVDWVGLDAYAFGETTAGQVLDRSTALMRRITHKPLLIAETATEPGPQAAGWTTSLFDWLKGHPDCIGFVWFNHNRDEGGNFDYKFTDTPARLAAFRTGIATLSLRPWPVVPLDAVH